MSKAYKQLHADLDRVKQYLLSHGVKTNELEVSSIHTQQLYKKDAHGNDTTEFVGYRLSQWVEVQSEDVSRLAGLASSVTELINQGVEFHSGVPQYLYRKLDELKLEMLARATENAKQRAENMGRASGNHIGRIRPAKMGVFQITPVHSTEVADYGLNDTSSLQKKVTAVVNASFSIE